MPENKERKSAMSENKERKSAMSENKEKKLKLKLIDSSTLASRSTILASPSSVLAPRSSVLDSHWDKDNFRWKIHDDDSQKCKDIKKEQNMRLDIIGSSTNPFELFINGLLVKNGREAVEKACEIKSKL